MPGEPESKEKGSVVEKEGGTANIITELATAS
jgi:hypothetical protein